MLGGLTGIGENILLERNQFEPEGSHLHIVHVFRIRHRKQFSVTQLMHWFGFPVIGQFDVLLYHGGYDRC